MTKIYNKKENKTLRRKLRKEQTKEELIFWAHVKDRRFQGLKFRRQYSIGNYIADFYCPELKLVVEIDGGQHYEDENIQKDISRSQYFENLGMKVKRYTNVDIKTNMAGVLDDLFCFRKPHPSPLLSKERG